jgi:hypothetical protein
MSGVECSNLRKRVERFMSDQRPWALYAGRELLLVGIAPAATCGALGKSAEPAIQKSGSSVGGPVDTA